MATKEIAAYGFVSVSKDITDSIRKIIDKSSIKFVRGIKLDTKNGKTEDRILVLTTWRLYFLAPKIPAKVETTFNFLEIRALNSHPEHQVIIDTDKSSFTLRFESREHLNHVVSHINFALSRIFNNSIFAPSICHSDSDLSEGSRKYSPSSEASVETQRACGGFSETYAALCDYNGISCKEEVQWDVDTIYHSQDNREFNLLDFSHLESRDLAVIVASMAYNTWFTKLYCKDLRIGSEVTEQVLHTVSKSSSLEEITLENAGLKSDFPHKMSAALSENPASVIHSLNLAHNSLDNQGVSNLIQQVCRLSKGLRLLNLSKTSLTSKGVVSLSQALCSSDEYSNSLLHLDLSKNPGVLSGEDASNLYLFLSQPNCLVHLDLSGTDCSVDSLFGALLRGCCADLSFLNLSKNSFSHRKVKDTLPLFRQFFSSAFSLTHVSLASMKLPPDVLRAVLTGLTSNPHINDLHLDISGCELRSAGAAVIQELFPRVSSIGTLDISDNGLDADLLTVLPALSRHPSLKHLHLGKNFNIKNRVLDEVLQKLVQLIQEEECALQTLSLTDSRLRSRGTVLVNALGSNTCLRKVDLSGNNMDDIGAKMLSKALQINTTLRSVTWDRNNTSAAGFLDVARALEHNFTLQYMPLPVSDISQAYRSAPERTEQALTKIQRSLVRNNQTQRFSQRQALRLHQGLVTSTAEQVMERLCVRVQQQVCILRGVGEMEEIQAAKQVLKEARNSRALYPSLCELAHVLSVDGPVRQRLDSLAGELAKAADKELQVIVDSMVSLCRELCPLSSSAAEQLSPTLSSVSERVSIPRSAIRTALMERAAQDIHRALEEVKLSVVSYLTNSIVDQILQELYATHKTLTRQVSHLKRWEGTCEDGTGWRFNRHRDSLDITDEELGTSIDTIAIKKHSSRTRRIRPVSTRLSLCDDSSSSPPPSVPSYSSPLSRSASWEGLSELPTQGLPLHHVTRVRPRPPRRHKGGHIPTETHCSENGGISPLDDGLPDFYTKRVLPDSQLSSLHKAHSLRRKKRRNMLAIFGFRKKRNQTLSNQATESEAEVYGDGCHTVATAPTGTATENVYTLLQPPRSAARAGSPGEGAEGKNTLVLSPPPVPGIPHPGVGGSKHPFYSPREKSEADAVLEQSIEADRYWADDKQRTTEVLQADKQWMEGRQSDQHVERQRLDDRLQERTFGEPRTTDRHWSESRHPERHMDRQWTVDRHTQRQIDRKIERQWMGGRQIDRSWSENRPTDIQVDNQWTESRHPGRKPDRQVQALHLAQRPLPPYPSDRTPSPKQETDPLKTTEAAATDWQDPQGERHACLDAEGWRSSTGGGASAVRAAPCASKPDPPPQSSKPNLSKLRQRHRLESSDALPVAEEEGETERDPGKMEKREREKRRDSEGHPPPIPEKPKTSSYVTYPKESANERNLPPPPVPPPVNRPVHGLPDRAASQGDEGLRPQAPVKPQRNRKAMSCDAGTDRESPNNVEKPPNRKPPVKKPRLPQNRNKSLDLSDSINSAPGHSELL
ncbi:capping protein, Arp2/3 and myosin-I linker protein 3-like isoform X1 [Thunnus thynnus]|uniref:capping protein, Arp2/3 and myosin-I linker protein 3-like isoform X1 n=1 Tax=Thunnus maccoyii TaxID=8240 RepID=UPI001C4C2D9D|nr:capping protein, Arp2/3 and myosin-I linker protein 3-like isoform X1 [Thunnus maccoyii]XP_042271529.1 capping protein, Arp2/3 and myosin-I linker protein 3-like isoform X1 [Thunnus maccoyii]XP_042271530.1 capping protein, Arp2/3 and myosin-I linker protein 3-like isoform X1 [Thunnus maccoyii]XP_042271531.1 capping protein, Arp2/3 and myosin-I linker protein 3-like isoform X1 [Thunnus maccoyii]XP_042271532.1 capping protein, Arp2/3 and myosin-I linker protein 3-like isoform X1 [Thunnus macco